MDKICDSKLSALEGFHYSSIYVFYCSVSLTNCGIMTPPQRIREREERKQRERERWRREGGEHSELLWSKSSITLTW